MKVIINLLIVWIGLFSYDSYATSTVLVADSLFVTRTIYNESISEDNNWVVTTNIATNKSRKSSLIGVNNNIQLDLGAVKSPKFSPKNTHLMVVDEWKHIVIYSLSSSSKIFVSSVPTKNYTINWNPNGSRLAFLTDNSLGIYNAFQNKECFTKDVIDFRWHPINSNLILLNTKNKDGYEVFEFDLDQHIKTKILFKSKNKIQLKEFTPNGKSFYLIEHINNEKEIIHFWNSGFYSNLNLNAILTNRKGTLEDIILNDEGNQIRFQTKDILDLKDDVLVWDTKEKWNPYRLHNYQKNVLAKSIFVWYPLVGGLRKLNSDVYPNLVKVNNFNYILKYNPLQYEPSYKQEQFIDLIYENLDSKENRLITSYFYYTPKTLQVSPSGNLILFFKDNNWWLHKSKINNTTNLTANIPSNFVDKNGLVSFLPYGFGGWSHDEKFIFIYDEFDIWKINAEDFSYTRYTKGKEKNIIYRSIMRFPTTLEPTDKYFTHKKYKLEDKQEIAVVDSNHVESNLYTTSNGISDFYLKNNQLFFIEQAFNYTPSTHVLDLENNKIKSFNTTQLSTIDSFSNLMITNVENDNFLRGNLLYPYNYDKNKKYPLIVQIYEDKSNYKNEFVPLTNLNSDGFNILTYLKNGYFVFLPQIKYTIGNPGISAFNAVEKQLDNLLKRNKSINQNAIGLIGHSFGGYEAAFIATQSKYFKTIVAGAPVFDLVNWYHDVNEEWMSNQDWRLEAQQFRIGGGYYEMKQNYINNSPLTFIENIKSPILLWTGQKDTNINYKQSVFMYNALKRLNKEAKLLVIKNEAHYMTLPKNQEFLTNEIFNWFEKYLK